jgi:hypothetical protein
MGPAIVHPAFGQSDRLVSDGALRSAARIDSPNRPGGAERALPDLRLESMILLFFA